MLSTRSGGQPMRTTMTSKVQMSALPSAVPLPLSPASSFHRLPCLVIQLVLWTALHALLSEDPGLLQQRLLCWQNSFSGVGGQAADSPFPFLRAESWSLQGFLLLPEPAPDELRAGPHSGHWFFKATGWPGEWPCKKQPSMT